MPDFQILLLGIEASPTIEGIPASRSMTEPMIVAARVPRKYSPVNKATGKENGIQNTRAKNEVIMVPVMNAKAPYCSLPGRGSHSTEEMK